MTRLSGEVSARTIHSTTGSHDEPGFVATLDRPEANDREAKIQEIIAKVRALRPLLREQQADAEEHGGYSDEVHQALLEAGVYHVLRPKRYGGFQLGVTAHFRVIAEVARGCPGTGWNVSLGAAHNLQIGSYFSEQAQDEIFNANPYFIAGASGMGMSPTIVKEPGGYRISGTWRYCSGSTHSTHFLGTIVLPSEITGAEASAGWFAVPREDYTILDDWGGASPQMGLRASGSNSTVVDDVFVPDHMMSDYGSWAVSNSGPSIGSELHNDPTYAGAFLGVAEGEVFAVAVGLGYAAIDEFERILTTSKVPRSPLGQLRGEHPDFQRALGLALGWVDSAAAISRRCGELYEEHCARSVAGVTPFGLGEANRIVGMNYTGEKLVYDTVQELIHSAGSSAVLNGATMQRYLRDIVQLHTRTDQFRFTAPSIAAEYLGDGFETDWSRSSPG